MPEVVALSIQSCEYPPPSPVTLRSDGYENEKVLLSSVKVSVPAAPETTVPARQSWYVVEAYCDLDAKGAPDMQIYGLSSSNQLMMNNEGQ